MLAIMIEVWTSITHLQPLDKFPVEPKNRQWIIPYSKSLSPLITHQQPKFRDPGCFMKLGSRRLKDQRNCTFSTHDSNSVINRGGIPKDDVTEEKAVKVITISNEDEINRYVKTVKSMLCSMDDGEISVSAYDTAWVALIEDVNGGGTPQFPSALQWIVNNQLPDGSWGDADVFSAYDRILCTLACVIVLKKWKVDPHKIQKGMSFFRDNLCKLEDENAERMTVGFELVFPSLIENARRFDIEVPEYSRIMQHIYSKRDLKLTKIPKDVMHNVPTTLLFSLEGIPGLDWEKILKLQGPDGSFFFSPASTAFAFLQTKDENCLRYLDRTIQRCKGAVPVTYPLDLMEHIWGVDRLQRLGISRHFKQEIKQCVDYVFRYWNDDGICWTRNYYKLPDIDDVSMGFMLLRSHGHQVSTDCFKRLEKEGDFFCYPGQSTESITAMLDLYRASQLRFPGEKILEDAHKFSSKFLNEKRAANEFVDKWVVCKDLPGEVTFALELPWYASLPRVDSRYYIEQYGGENEVWISKTLYRMPYVSNNVYLDLAKLDYNNCQAVHSTEWEIFQKWHGGCNLANFGVSKRALLLAYFLAAASIYEPERSKERLAWAKTTILLQTIESFFNTKNHPSKQRTAFIDEFKDGFHIIGRRSDDRKTGQELVMVLLGTIHHLSFDASMAYGRDISLSLHQAWEKWLLKWEVEGDRHQGEAELLVRTIDLTSGCSVFEETLRHHPEFEQLCNLANRLCCQLGHYQKHKGHYKGSFNRDSDRITTPEIESGIRELVQLVLQNSPDGIESNIKQSFLTVVKSFYYTAYCNSETINYHIAKVLFERV